MSAAGTLFLFSEYGGVKMGNIKTTPEEVLRVLIQLMNVGDKLGTDIM
jgi:hypothetical protein